MRLTKSFLTILLASAAVLAQSPNPPGGGGGFARMLGAGPGGPGMGPRGHKLVTGAPYSADMNVTHTQTLPDGNVIQNTTSGKEARDAAGRVYFMHTSTGGPLGQTGPVTRISIVDPVAGYAYELNPTAKTAIRRELHQPPAGSEAGGGRWNSEAKANAAARPANPNVAKADLGLQIVNGVSAQGNSTIRTIPAGTIGNAKALVSKNESWYSPELQIVISSKFSDPRGGDSVFALTNIQKTADPSLFQVPAGYTITDAPKGHGGFGGRPGMPPPPQE